MKQNKIKYFLKVESKTENLFLIRNFVSNKAKELGFDEDDINKIALAVDEACTNIIRHAYKYQPDKPIEIYLTVDTKRFEIKIIDYGEPFKPAKIKMNDPKNKIVKYNKGGLGMFLIYSLMDNIEYRRNKNRNEVRLIKLLPK